LSTGVAQRKRKQTHDILTANTTSIKSKERSVRDAFLQTRREKFFLKQTRVRVATWVPLLELIEKLKKELQMKIVSKELRENGC